MVCELYEIYILFNYYDSSIVNIDRLYLILMASLLSQNYVSTYQCCSKAPRVRMHYLVFNHLIACIAKLTVNPNRIQNGATLTNDLLVRQTCNHFIMERNRSGIGGESKGEKRRSKFRVRDCLSPPQVGG